MMTQEKIDKAQRYHDVLVALVTGEIELGYSQEAKDKAHAALDVLCWILDHDHNKEFVDNMDKLMIIAAKKGYILKKL